MTSAHIEHIARGGTLIKPHSTQWWNAAHTVCISITRHARERFHERIDYRATDGQILQLAVVAFHSGWRDFRFRRNRQSEGRGQRRYKLMTVV